MNRSPVNDNAVAKRAAACLICGRPRALEHRPFCSSRCADVDLHRWLSGSYVLTGRDESADDEPVATSAISQLGSDADSRT